MDKFVNIESVKPRMEELIGAALDLLGIDSLDSDNEEQELINIANELCAAIPAADVEPVIHARWIYHRDITGNYFVCSHCTESRVDCEETFCCKCGAKMDGEDGKSDE